MNMRVVEVHTVTWNGGLVRRFKQREDAQACLDEFREKHRLSGSFSPLRIEHGFALEVDATNGPMHFALSFIGVEP